MATTKEQQNKKLVTAHAKSLHISPRKVRLVTNLVKNMRVTDALAQLQFTNKKSAPELVKLLRSAVANAEHNFSMNPEDLFVKSLTCDMGKTMRRYFPRARGSAFVIRRKMSHVHVVLEERKSKAAKASRFAALRRTREKKPVEASVVETTELSTNVTEKTLAPEQTRVKTDEQIKMNKVQNKRRLFNRKSGE